MPPTDLFQVSTYNQRLKTKWVWEWLSQLPVHCEFEDSESGSTGSDGAESQVGDCDGERAGGGGDGEHRPGYRRAVDVAVDVVQAEVKAGSEMAASTGLFRVGKKRVFAEEGGDKEVIGFAGGDRIRDLGGMERRPAKKVRLGAF